MTKKNIDCEQKIKAYWQKNDKKIAKLVEIDKRTSFFSMQTRKVLELYLAEFRAICERSDVDSGAFSEAMRLLSSLEYFLKILKIASKKKAWWQ